MSNVGSQGGSNKEALEVTSRYVPSPDDITIQIKRVKESALPLFNHSRSYLCGRLDQGHVTKF